MRGPRRGAIWARLQRRRVPALLVILGLAVAGLGILAYELNAFRRLELDTVDARFTIRGRHKPPKNLLLVLVDARTFRDLPNVQWPYPRHLHGQVIARIAHDRPKAIAFDVQFTEQTNPRDDNALIDAVDAARPVVLSTTETDPRGHTRIFGGDSVLREIGARAGSTNYRTDPGGVFRRTSYEIDHLKTFGIVTAEAASGHPIPASALGGRTAWIDYPGPPGTIPSISYSRVLRGQVPPGLFRDKIVVIGASVPSLQDVHATSTTGNELMPGSEAQAAVIATALAGFPLQDVPRGVVIALIILLALLTPLACLRLSPIRAAAVALLGALVYLVAAQVAFDHNAVLSVTYPLAALVLSAALALAAQGSLTALERARVRAVFARFVPGAVVDEVLANTDDDLRLGGVRREVTVMFTDLRGFTTFSERRDPDQVIGVLNRYLTEMTDAIMEHGGTLISFMGDGIMAVFGAPLEQDDHADRALEASRDMLGWRLGKVNTWLQAESICDGFRMGVGLNSGTIMAGNVGSDRRMEYTAIGDTTNTASRLEGATKNSGFQGFVSESTYALLKRPSHDLVDAGEIAIRGREQGMRVWGLRGPEPAPEGEAEKPEGSLA